MASNTDFVFTKPGRKKIDKATFAYNKLVTYVVSPRSSLARYQYYSWVHERKTEIEVNRYLKFAFWTESMRLDYTPGCPFVVRVCGNIINTSGIKIAVTCRIRVFGIKDDVESVVSEKNYKIKIHPGDGRFCLEQTLFNVPEVKDERGFRDTAPLDLSLIANRYEVRIDRLEVRFRCCCECHYPDDWVDSGSGSAGSGDDDNDRSSTDF